MKLISWLIILVISSLTIPCSAEQVWLEWMNTFGGTGWAGNYVTDMAVDSQDNTYLTGYGQEFGSSLDFFTLKYDSSGSLLWIARYDGPRHQVDKAKAIAVDAEGYVYVTGTSEGLALNSDVMTIKYDENGEELWEARYFGPNNGSEGGACISVDDSGNVYVGGYYSVFTTESLMIKYDASGVQQWVMVDTNPESDYVVDIAIDNDQNIVVFCGGADEDFVTVKLNSAGDQLWSALYPSNNIEYPENMVLDESGNIYVGGSSGGVWTASTNFLIVKYNPSGEQQTVWTYNNPNNTADFLSKIAVDNAGNLIACGKFDSNPGSATDFDIVTVRFNPAGELLWSASYAGTAGGEDESSSIAVDSVGNVYVVGHSIEIGELWNAILLKYNHEGETLWNFNYRTRFNQEWNCVSISSTGHVYTSGISNSSTMGWAVKTAKYDQGMPDLSLTLIPSAYPIQIPLQGGSFNYFLRVTNNESPNLPLDLWNSAIFPDGTVRELLQPPRSILLQMGTAGWMYQQNVPACAPAGIYQFIGNMGYFNDHTLVADTLYVEKLSSGDGRNIDNWDIDESSSDLLRRTNDPEISDASSIISSISPNPFNPTTTIRFDLPQAARVTLEVFDISGRIVYPSGSGTTPITGFFPAGEQSLTFDGSGLPSGIYLYRLTASGSGATPTMATGKMVLLK